MRAPMMLPGVQPPQAHPMLTPVEFNARSKALLAEVNPQLAELMIAVEAAHPDAFEITEGMRDKERQAQLVAEGKSQTMNSRHLTGNAVDIAMIGPDGQPNWNFEDYRPIADTAKVKAAAMGIPDFVWGGDWRTLKDGVHFQIGGPGVTPGEGGGLSMGDGAPLSFGLPGVQDPSAMGLSALFGNTGMSMGAPVPGRPGVEQQLAAQAKQETDTKRKIALADLMRF